MDSGYVLEMEMMEFIMIWMQEIQAKRRNKENAQVLGLNNWMDKGDGRRGGLTERDMLKMSYPEMSKYR